MKNGKSITLSFLTGILLFFLVTPTASAQIDNVSRILQASQGDANILVREYLKPFGSGFGAGINTGWTNTAQPHKKFGFDITITTGLAVVPGSDKSFDVTQIGLQQLELESGPSITQTINGSDESPSNNATTLAAYETINGQRVKLFQFDMPSGTGFGYVPAPKIKVGLGLFKDTEIMVRYVPEISIEDYGTFKQTGFGAKHGINQWLPGGKLLPVDISIMAGFTNLNVTSDFRITDQDVITDPNNTENPYAGQSTTWDGQKVEINTDAFTFSALVGKTLPIISVYGGVGLETSTMSIKTPGTYPTIVPNPAFETDPQNEDPLLVDTIEQPIDVELEGGNSFHALAGFRLKLSVFHISASYTLSNYSTLNAGFGFTFR
ncbi:hypothetical protein G3570_08790 [Balneolaceae bacterium YR4-1]|uniref:Outer membrane protein beta-barrel domain-containing protein n=1 Tax=Halalkalibaculum roseum TaxID=2709311 RepID=A0A6M1SWZ9_9BACT|nr:DUF6588 family protein [Halalkalibaculum roseum]NGP76728.1 hypothetical protein [Halalkalibaculum roseum]